MFYTGSTFLSSTEITNIETVGLAHSDDLFEWSKDAAFRVRADPRWYEILSQGTWHEEAWRDPWVFRDPSGHGWHMLVTAREAGQAAERDRGVVAHATSADLNQWAVEPPLSAAGSGFAHLEVPQTVRFADRDWLLFSCDSAHLAGDRVGEIGGIWIAPAASSVGPYDTAAAELLLDERYYSGRIVFDREGELRLLAFENAGAGGQFHGRIADPFDVMWDGTRPRIRDDGREREAS
jgi:beta-fructofuranosidase